MPFELLKSEAVYPGRAFTIRRDTMRLPDGRETSFDIRRTYWIGHYHPVG